MASSRLSSASSCSRNASRRSYSHRSCPSIALSRLPSASVQRCSAASCSSLARRPCFSVACPWFTAISRSCSSRRHSHSKALTLFSDCLRLLSAYFAFPTASLYFFWVSCSLRIAIPYIFSSASCFLTASARRISASPCFPVASWQAALALAVSSTASVRSASAVSFSPLTVAKLT